MMKKSSITLFLAASILVWMTFSCGSKSQNREEITVFCCAGLTEVLTLMSDSFMAKNPVDIHLNFASSGTLARQLKNGAPADLYLSASDDWMHYCIQNNLVDSITSTTFLRNKLVWIVPFAGDIDSLFSISKIDSTQKIAIGDPTHVPAGMYAKDYLQNLKQWDKLQPQLIPCRDVKNTLFMVEHGEVEYGLVYYSDAIRSDKVKIIEIIPDSLHIPIRLSMSAVAKAGKVQEFFAFLMADSNQVYYKKYGFTPVKE